MKSLSGGARAGGSMSGGGGFGITANMRSIRSKFVDREIVQKRFNRMALRTLKRYGALTRSVARRGMRVGGKKAKVSQFDPELAALVGQGRNNAGQFTGFGDIDVEPWPVVGSLPGKPPKARTRKLKDGIFFIANIQKRSVIIGPQMKAGADIPGLLEFGGTSKDERRRWVVIWEGGRRKIRLAKGNGAGVKIKARPYMKPAYEAALSRLVPQMYRDAL